jgi:hypothetical protein
MRSFYKHLAMIEICTLHEGSREGAAEGRVTWNIITVGPKVTTQRGVIWPRDSLLPGGRGREPREAERRQEFKYPSLRLSMI